LTRSPVGQIAGLNLQQIAGPRLSDLSVRAYVLYDESAAFAPELRERIPDALICLRLILNSDWGDPERTAREAARLVRDFPQVDVICPGNEQNLENNADSAAIALWSGRFADEWQRQGRPRAIVTPAVSPGRPFDLGALAGAWARFDYIGVHAYATLDDLGFGAALAHIAAHRAMWPQKDQLLTEFNIDKLEETTFRHAEGAAAVERFLRKLADLGYVKAAMWFLDDAHHDDQPYRLVRIPPLLDLFRRVGHEQGGQTPPGDGGSVDRNPTLAAIAAKYNITYKDGATIYVAELIERPDPANITADCPPDALCRVSTNDNQHQTAWASHVDLPFSHPAAYNPAQGQRGFYYAICEDARVDGLGWAFGLPDDTAPHRNVAVRFARRTGQPEPAPQPGGGTGTGPPPAPVPLAWRLAFADFARRNPAVGAPIADIDYLPPDFRRAIQFSEKAVLIYDGGVYAVPPLPAPLPSPTPPLVPARTLFFEDAGGVDVGPLLLQYAGITGVLLQGLIALIHAESGFDPHAVRRGAWPDVSAGYSQMTVQTAAGYGVGNGSADAANVESVLAALQDRETGIRLAAANYATCLGVVDRQFPGVSGDERLILGMRAYNGGAAYGLTDDYATKFASHIASYRAALDLTYRVLANKGWRPG
jgi:hypothetical protein